MGVDIIRRLGELRGVVADWRKQGLRVGVVPTMGALHDGHLSLVRAGLENTDRVIVTLFVNPKQFNSAADLAAYPRTEQADAAKLEPLGAHVLYVPDGDQIYPPGFATTVSVEGVTEGLCGAHRPGHFNGVATVVTKLLLQTGGDFAYFGEKDYQQLLLVKRLVADLNIPVEIVGCPTIREADGMAMSSRNVHLNAAERRIGPALAQALFRAADNIAAGASVAVEIEAARASVLAAGYDTVEYLELRGADDLVPMADLDRPGRLLAAAQLGKTRLIDNVPVAFGI